MRGVCHSRLPFTPHLSWGSSVSGQVVFRLRRRSAPGWCSAPWRRGTSPGWRSGRGWPAGSHLLAPQLLRSSATLCGLRWAMGARPALAVHVAAVLRWEMRGSSAGYGIVILPGGVALGWGGWRQEGRCSGQGRGLVLLARVWSEWDNHMDPS